VKSVPVKNAVSPKMESMSWLRLVGSLKRWVSFAKEPYKRAYILQKRPIMRRCLLIIATPYAYITSNQRNVWGYTTYIHDICTRVWQWVRGCGSEFVSVNNKSTKRVWIYDICPTAYGSLKSHFSFAEYRLFYRALLQKRPTILMSLLIVATP